MDVSFLGAFAAGLASFLMPCILPMIPVYIASLAGPGALSPAGDRPGRSHVVTRSASFVVGFSLVFILLGSIAGLIGASVSLDNLLLRNLSGALLIGFGLFMLASLWVPALNFEKRLDSSSQTTTYLHAFLLGAIFALGWTPCLGPVLGGILVLAMSRETVWQAIYLLASYSLGLGLPFLITGVALDYLAPLLRWLGRYSRWVYLGMAILLILTGALTAAGKIDSLY